MLSSEQVRRTFELLKIPISRVPEGSPIYFRCPFEYQHTKTSRDTDCALFFDNGPGLWCFHQTCNEELRQFSDLLRFEVTGSCRGIWDPSRVFTGPKPDHGFAEEVAQNRAALIREYSGRLSVAPVAVSSADLLRYLFAHDDVVWVGREHHSGEAYAHHFATIEQWKVKPPRPNWDFTCASTFWPGSCHRGNEGVARRHYLVLESDRKTAEGNPIAQDEQLAMLAWARGELKLELQLIVFSGNKSDHGWYEWPGEDWLREHKPALIAMGFDAATMRKSQPVRLGGAINSRTGKKQEVLWLDK